MKKHLLVGGVTFFKSIYYRHHTINSFVYFLNEDNQAKYEEFRCKKEIIDTKETTSTLQHIDMDHYHDKKGYLKELPYDKPFLAVQRPLGSGKTYQITQIIEKNGKHKKYFTRCR